MDTNDIVRVLKHATTYHGNDDKETKAVQACIEVLIYDFEDAIKATDNTFDGDKFIQACGIINLRGY